MCWFFWLKCLDDYINSSYNSNLKDNTSNIITISGCANKWLCFSLSQDDITLSDERCVEYIISYSIDGATVLYTDDNVSLSTCISGESIGEIIYQGGEIVFYVYCTKDLSNATISFALASK